MTGAQRSTRTRVWQRWHLLRLGRRSFVEGSGGVATRAWNVSDFCAWSRMQSTSCCYFKLVRSGRAQTHAWAVVPGSRDCTASRCDGGGACPPIAAPCGLREVEFLGRAKRGLPCRESNPGFALQVVTIGRRTGLLRSKSGRRVYRVLPLHYTAWNRGYALPYIHVKAVVLAI
jgi:hypothetical protein